MVIQGSRSPFLALCHTRIRSWRSRDDSSRIMHAPLQRLPLLSNPPRSGGVLRSRTRVGCVALSVSRRLAFAQIHSDRDDSKAKYIHLINVDIFIVFTPYPARYHTTADPAFPRPPDFGDGVDDEAAFCGVITLLDAMLSDGTPKLSRWCGAS